MGRELRRNLHASKQKGVRTATAADVVLQSFVRIHHMAEKFEEPDEIGLARAVGTNQYIEAVLKAEFLQFPDGFVSSQSNLLQRVPFLIAHTSSRLVNISKPLMLNISKF